jgi:hypothetical protein
MRQHRMGRLELACRHYMLGGSATQSSKARHFSEGPLKACVVSWLYLLVVAA